LLRYFLRAAGDVGVAEFAVEPLDESTAFLRREVSTYYSLTLVRPPPVSGSSASTMIPHGDGFQLLMMLTELWRRSCRDDASDRPHAGRPDDRRLRGTKMFVSRTGRPSGLG
jgi:hypothetical protein